jgi:uncharacterized protein involved in response to NO
MLWILLALAIVFGAIAYDIVGGASVKGESTRRAWHAFAAGFFLGPIGLILAMMMRAEILRGRGR